MLEEVIPGIYKVQVPLPKNPLKYLNSYIIKGESRSLVIDTGLNRPECYHALILGIEHLGISFQDVDFFLTHMHPDHSGLIPELKKEDNRVYCSYEDAQIINTPLDWSRILEYILACGIPEQEFKDFGTEQQAFKYGPRGKVDFNYVQDGDALSVNGFDLYCISTPGHSIGHMCLYEPDHEILFAGDHILREITPNIAQWQENTNPLKRYLTSLDKISEYSVAKVLPGHRSLFSNMQERISEIKKHHTDRLLELLKAFDRQALTAYELASRISWDLNYSKWEDLPVAQKAFATTEALAHLTYLQGKDLLEFENKNGLYLYSSKIDSVSALTLH